MGQCTATPQGAAHTDLDSCESACCGYAPTIKEGSYIGCFTELHVTVDCTQGPDPGRDLNGTVDGKGCRDSDTNTPESCNSYCAGYKYYGVQDSNYCFCGNAYARGGNTEAPLSDCNMACTGNPDQMCGADFHNSVYARGSCKPQ